MPSGQIHVAIDESQQVVPIGSCGIPQVDHGDLVAIVFAGHGAVVPGQVSLGIQCQIAHAAGAGIFQIWIQKEGGFANTACADHQAVDIVAIHQCCNMIFPAKTAQHQALLSRQMFSLPPEFWLEGYMAICFLNLPLRRPAGGAVLPVTHSFALDIVQGVVLGEKCQPAHHDQSHRGKANQ